MSDLYEEYGLEQEGEFGADPKLPTDKPKKVKKSGGWLGRIIAFLLGIVIAIGSCAGIAFAVVTQPVRNLVGYLGMDFETQVKDSILTEQYGNATLLQLSQDALTAAVSKDLAGLDNIFPMVGVYIGELADKMRTQFGVELDAQEMMDTHMDMLPEYIGGKFKNTPLGKLLEATKGGHLDPLLMEICYGEEGVDYVLDKNGDPVMLDGKKAVTVQMLSSNSTSIIDKVSLASVVHPKVDDSNGSIMLEVCYGKEGVTFELVKDADGEVLVDNYGGAVVEMLPFFLNKNEDGDFIDYNGNLFPCAVLGVKNGYIKIEEYFKGTTDVKATYFVKDDGNGNYYARTDASDSADEVLFDKITIGDMTNDSTQIIDNIYLKDALGIKYAPGQKDPHGVLMSLAYGEKGKDYIVTGEGDDRQIEMINGASCRTIGDLRRRGSDLINDIALADIMGEDRNDAITMYMLYGKKDGHYIINSDGEVEMQKQRIAICDAGHIYNEYGEQYQERTEENSGYVIDLSAGTFINVDDVEYTLEETTDTVETSGGTATWYYLKQDGEYTYYSKSTLRSLVGTSNLASNLTKRMTVSDIFGESAENNRFLKHLKESTINDLPDAISDLTVGQVFEQEIYVSGTTQVTPKWSYLLKQNGEIRTDYKVAGEINQLLDNMTNNINDAPLKQLHADGIIALDESALNTELKRSIAGNSITGLPPEDEAKYLGDLTSAQLLNYISQVLTYIS